MREYSKKGGRETKTTGEEGKREERNRKRTKEHERGHG